MIGKIIVAGGVAAASLALAAPAAADDAYEWFGIASPNVQVCAGIETVIPFFNYIGDCTADLTTGEVLPEDLADFGG